VTAVGRRLPFILALTLGVAALLLAVGPFDDETARAAADEVRVLAGEPSTLDPARVGDAGSAAVVAQLYEGLTALDGSLVARPALARSWDVLDGGRRVVFHLRDGLTFSDGTPLTSDDVVRSWLRLLDPADPSPLVSLLSDVEGALPYARGEIVDPAAVGFRALGNDVEVRLDRPADIASIVSGPSFGVVPASLDPTGVLGGDSFVGSGGYTIDGLDPSGLILAANERYWAGTPAVPSVRLVYDIGGRSPVEAFADGELDYAPISAFDATWIGYDPDLGPQLRSVPSLTTDYYGFDTSRPPFDDARVRRAFAMAVDWKRIVRLTAEDRAIPATGMVPVGIPGRSEADLTPGHDPQAARAALAEAGYPGGVGFPSVTLVSAGYDYDEAVVAELRDVLGIDVRAERMPADQYFDRLAADPPAFWSLSWVADYPSPNDFLGVLLGSGQSSNYARWSSAEFDAAIGDALAAPDAASARDAYTRAERVVQREVPVIPASYGTGWALARDGLLGARENGLGILRLAGLAWSDR